LHSKWTFISDLSSYAGSENASFQLLKVLAIGQTSGSGGWVKKLTSITMEGNGLPMVVGNPKKNEDFALLLEWRHNQI
jgi:hypothetical protein